MPNPKQPPFVKWKIAAHDVLPSAKKRRVDLSIEYHTKENIYFLVASLPKSGSDNVIISKSQAESLAETFKINVTNVR